MDKPSIPNEKSTVLLSTENNQAPQPSAYAESIRITPKRLLNAVIKNMRQGDKNEH